MKKHLFSILLFVLTLLIALPVPRFSAAASAQAADSDIRIMSANLRAEFASWTSDGVAPEPTSTRVVWLEAILNATNPIAVGAQEVSPSWYTAFSKLDSAKWGWLTESDAAGYSYYNFVPNVGKALNTILYRKDLLTLNAHGVEAYAQRSNGQCLVWAVFTVKASGKQFVMLSSHWTPGNEKVSERLAQSDQLAETVNRLKRNYADTVIVTGDFNCSTDTAEFRKFLVSTNSWDSRSGAAVRGDSMAKIDHITATADASFLYHTICYEANSTYDLSDHPFALADIKLGSSLLFDFTDDTDARAHYKQGVYRYNSFDYNSQYWLSYSGYSTNQVIDRSSGTLSFQVTSSGNPFIMPSTVNTTDPASAYGLNYDLSYAEIARIRFRLDGCDSSDSLWISFAASNTQTGIWALDAKSYQFKDANGKYLVLDIPLTSSGVKSLKKIESFRINFANVKNGKVTVDYIYLGKNPDLPLDDALFFDFTNTKNDQARYNTATYGNYNFDLVSNWRGRTFGFTSGTQSIADGALTIGATVAGETSIYADTEWNSSSPNHPIHFVPTHAETFQIRFKMANLTGTAPKASIHFYNGTTLVDISDYVSFPASYLSSQKYLTVTGTIPQEVRNVSSFDRIIVHFSGLTTKTSSTVTIDYVYVGPESGLPSQHVYAAKLTAPTCTAKGYTTHTCATCAYSYKDSYTAATGHKLTKTTWNPATCTTAGNKTYWTCSTCKKVYADEACTSETTADKMVIPATGHTLVKTTWNPATCTTDGNKTYWTCSTCKKVYADEACTSETTADKMILPATGHSYTHSNNGENHTANCASCGNSYTEAHSYENGTCICGAVEVVKPSLDENITINHTLNLASDISIIYAVRTDLLAGYDSYVLECVLPVYEGNTLVSTTTVTVEPVLTGNYYYFTLTGITAVRMNDLVEATLHMTKDGMDYISNVDSYSVATYAYAQLDKAGAAGKLKALCADLLRYGAAAQSYKGYRTNALVDSGMTEAQLSYLSDIDAVTFGNNNVTLNDVTNPGITWAGKLLNLESKVELKFVINTSSYTGSLDGLSLRISYTDRTGAAKTAVITDLEAYNAANHWYAFSFDGLLAAELRQVVSAAVYAGDIQVSPTLCYSADTYGNNKTGTLLTLCKALFAYSDTALAYFN